MCQASSQFLAVARTVYVPCVPPVGSVVSEWATQGQHRAPALRRPFQRRCFLVRRAALVRATTHPTACIPLAQQRAWWLAGWLAFCADLVSRAQSGSQPPGTRVTPRSPLPMRCGRALLCSCVACACTACSPCAAAPAPPAAPAFLQAVGYSAAISARAGGAWYNR